MVALSEAGQAVMVGWRVGFAVRCVCWCSICVGFWQGLWIGIGRSSVCACAPAPVGYRVRRAVIPALFSWFFSRTSNC